jgi:hypothetical protein
MADWYYWQGAVTGEVEGRIVIVDLAPFSSEREDPKGAAALAIRQARASYPTIEVRRCRLQRLDDGRELVLERAEL